MCSQIYCDILGACKFSFIRVNKFSRMYTNVNIEKSGSDETEDERKFSLIDRCFFNTIRKWTQHLGFGSINFCGNMGGAINLIDD